MIATVGKLHEYGAFLEDDNREILKIDRKYLNRRGRRAKELASKPRVDDYADGQYRLKAVASHDQTHDMSFEDAIDTLLLDGKRSGDADGSASCCFVIPGT